MSDETTQTGRVGDRLRLGEVMESNTAELSHLEAFRVRLTEMTRDVRELFKEQAALKASKQDASKRLDVLLREGDRLATLIRQALRQHYGIHSEKLAEFGLQPFRGRKPRTKKRPAAGSEPRGRDSHGSQLASLRGRAPARPLSSPVLPSVRALPNPCERRHGAPARSAESAFFRPEEAYGGPL